MLIIYLKKLSELLFHPHHSAKIAGCLALAADGLSAISGLAFGNIGRSISGFAGASANLPIILFSGRQLKPGEIDPQDLPFRERIKHIWKFWKYPFEWQAATNFVQAFALGFLSGPNTASEIGQAADISALLSTDAFRPCETIMGISGLAACAIGFVREEKKTENETSQQKGFLRNLAQEFNIVGNVSTAAKFAFNRAVDIQSEGLFVHRGLMKAFNHGCCEIQMAGPNKIVGRTWNTCLPFWMAESAYLGDLSNLASGAVYMAYNVIVAFSSKRSVAAEPTTKAPSPSLR